MADKLIVRYWDDPVLSTLCDSVEDNEFGPRMEEFGESLLATMDNRASADGHAVAQSTRDKISATRKAKIASGEIKMPAGALTHWIGKTQSAESNRKRSVTLAGKYVGELNSMFGKKWTPAHRANIMKAREEKRNV